MSLEFISEMLIPVVVVACLVLGFIMKHWFPTDNRIIPTVLTFVGAVLGCVVMQEIALEPIVYGAVSGLASTGLHQSFKQILNIGGEENE